MSEEVLSGGRMIGVNPNRLKLGPNAQDPKWRMEVPGTLEGNVATFAQLDEVFRKAHNRVEPTLVKIKVRALETGTYIVVAPVPAKIEGDEDIYEIKHGNHTDSPRITGLKPLLAEAQIPLRADVYYEMTPKVMRDAELGQAVVLNWTTATTVPRPSTSSKQQTAAGSDPDPEA